MKYYCYKKSNVIRLVFGIKIETAVLLYEAAKIYIKCKVSKTTLVAFLGKDFTLSLLTHKKQQWRITSATSFIEFSVPIYKESHYHRKLIMMSIPAIDISYKLEHFIRSSCEDNKEISDSFT